MQSDNYNFLLKEIFFLCVFFITVGLIFSGSSFADETNSATETKEELKSTSGNQQGLKVYIDPDTGELVSQPEEGEQIVQPNNSVFGEGDEIIQQPEEIIHPDGSATVIMPESFQHSTKITIDENGKQVTECKREHEHAHE